jgi:hypothetical protein
MNLIHADTPIMFAGNEEPAAFLEVGTRTASTPHAIPLCLH